MDMASLMLEMGRDNDVITVLRNAMHLATPDERVMAQDFLQHVQTSAAQEQHQSGERQRVLGQPSVDADPNAAPANVLRKETMPLGPHQFLLGVIKDVHCGPPDGPTLNFTLASGAKTIEAHSGNYYDLKFSAVNFTPRDDFDPCKDLEGMSAKIEYVESSDKPPVDYVVAIELHK